MKQRSRRQFLEESMLAAAAAASVGSWRLASAEETTTSTSPNEKIGVAMVGVRGRGGEHLKAYTSRTDTEVLWIVDADTNVGQARVDEVGKEHRAASRNSRKTCARPLPTRPSTSSRSPRPITGTRWLGHLGDAARQGRLRREAGQPQRQRRTARRRSGPQVQQDLSDRHTKPVQSRHEQSDGIYAVPATSDRSPWHMGFVTSGVRRSDRGASILFRRRSTTTCGRARRRWHS